MTNRILPILFSTTLACGLSAALAFTAPSVAQAQPDKYGDTATTGEITVSPGYRAEWNSETRRFENRVTDSVVVDVSDLDLNTGWGIREMKVRVMDAARQVCNGLDDEVGGDDYDADRACFQRATTHALRSVPEYVAFNE